MSQTLAAIRVSPWYLAAAMAVVASVLSGMATIEVRRRTATLPAMAALMACDFCVLLCAPSLPPAMVTAIAGVGVVFVVAGGWVDNPKPAIRVAAVVIVIAVVAIAIDTHTQSPEPSSTPGAAARSALWGIIGIAGVGTATATIVGKTGKNPIAAVIMIVGAGIQAVGTLALVYMVMQTGNAAAIPALAASALFQMYVLQSSLKINALYRHMPLAYAVWQIGVLLSAPAVTEMTYHGGVVTTLATLSVASAAVSIAILE